MGQINLFKNYLYSIGPCAKKQNKNKKQKNKEWKKQMNKQRKNLKKQLYKKCKYKYTIKPVPKPRGVK